MVLVLTVPNGAAGVQVDLDSPATGPFLSPVAEIFGIPDPAYGAQLAWAINPGTGNDSGAGTPADPLRTMAEFSRRMSGPMLVTVAATLQLVGNVIDSALQLSGTRFALGASLTISGTRTLFGSGTVSVVTALGLGSAPNFPWQITTTGFDWTTVPSGAQIRLSNSTVASVLEVIGANDVVVCPTTAAASVTAPTAALTFTVETLSRALPPFVSALVASPGTSTVFVSLTWTDVSFDNGGLWLAGIGMLFLWCEVKAITQEWTSTSLLRFIGTRVTLATSALFRIKSGPANFLTNGVSLVTPSGAAGSLLCQGGQHFLTSTAFNSAVLQVLGQAYAVVSSGLSFRNTANPIQIFDNSTLNVTTTSGGSINGATGNTGVALNINSGRLLYVNAAGKPTLTAGAGNDVRLGNAVTLTYAAIGAGRTTLALDAIPPTTTVLTGGGTATFAQIV